MSGQYASGSRYKEPLKYQLLTEGMLTMRVLLTVRYFLRTHVLRTSVGNGLHKVSIHRVARHSTGSPK
jgi:hypothetical protein